MDLSFIQCIVTHLSQERQIKALFEGERDEIQHLHQQDAFHKLQLKDWGCAPEPIWAVWVGTFWEPHRGLMENKDRDKPKKTLHAVTFFEMKRKMYKKKKSAK